jgi:hypothetical protein
MYSLLLNDDIHLPSKFSFYGPFIEDFYRLPFQFSPFYSRNIGLFIPIGMQLKNKRQPP